jgi:hypothetical protein
VSTRFDFESTSVLLAHERWMAQSFVVSIPIRYGVIIKVEMRVDMTLDEAKKVGRIFEAYAWSGSDS